MRRLVLVVTVLLCVLLFSSVSLARPRVGVFEFSGNSNKDSLRQASSALTRVLVSLDRFDVVERAEIDRILSEQRFQLSGIVDPGTAAEVGKILGVNLAFFGQVDSLETRWESNANSGYYSSDAQITVKVVEVETGRLLHVLVASGSGNDSNHDMAISKAVSDSFGSEFVAQVRQAFSLNTGVVKVGDSIVYFLLGRQAGVTDGARFLVQRKESHEIGVDLGDTDAFTRTIGMVEVTAVTNSTARAQVIWETEPIEIGDMIQEITKPEQKNSAIILQTVPYSVKTTQGTTQHGTTLSVNGRWGEERPFTYEYGTIAGASLIAGQVLLLNGGGYAGIEIPLEPGRLYVSVRGIAGGIVANQHYSGYAGWDIPQSGSATGTSFYLGASSGVKLYPTPTSGFRFELGLSGQYSPGISTWTKDINKELDRDVTKYVQYPVVNTTGLSIYAGIGLTL